MKKILFVLLLLLVSNTYSGERITIPSGLFYYQPAASVFGPEAVWVNPAGLARYKTNSSQLMLEYVDKRFAKSWGTASTGDKLGFAYRYLYNHGEQNTKEYTFASGAPFGNFNIGLSYQYFKDGPGILDNRHFWNLGFLGNFSGKFNWAAVFYNTNKSQINNEVTGIEEATETEQRFSLSYRPYGNRLTCSVDMFLSTGTRLSDADYIYHAEYRPTPGLIVDGYISSDRDFQIGVKANLLKYFIGNKSKFDKHGNGQGSTIFIGATSLRQPSLIKQPNRRLRVSVANSISENPPQPIFGKKTISFSDYILNLYRAAEDPSINEMILKLKPHSFGFGQAQEFRNALSYFQKHKKKIVCYLESPDNISYYIASVADSILIPPVSQLNLIGLKSELTFYAGTLEKLGIKADMMRIGKYKTAAEMFTKQNSTLENKKQINRILDNIYDQFVAGIALARGISLDSTETIIDNGPFTSEEALEFDLVDGLSYADEISDNYLTRMPEITFKKYLSDTLINDNWEKLPTIAIVTATGEIKDDSKTIYPFDNSSGLTPSAMRRAFKGVQKNKDIDAVLFRINSPGGFALAAEEIFHQAKKTSHIKPTVVSMGNVAASGGYHIAMTTDKIFANSGTITGSIGIFGGKLDLSGLYEKIEMGKEIYTRGKYAGMLSSIRPFSEDEREKYFSHMKSFYDHFLTLVAENRELTVDSVNNLGEGRVWTGQEANKNGLVDNIGGLKDALDFIASENNYSDYRVELYPQIKPLFLLPGNSLLSAFGSLFSKSNKDVSIEKQIVGDNNYLFERLPYDIIIE
ncbi:MAG: signal peptide peptidase SppA [Candidatus Zixiibacteriota bacterium]|nr:MAG: signal peptide peptidase SppA [candidate division Zixibacteria bacterium]